MLVLTRKLGQKIVIGKDVVVEVIELGQGGKVRLGITAPLDVKIVRAEVASEEADASSSGAD